MKFTHSTNLLADMSYQLLPMQPLLATAEQSSQQKLHLDENYVALLSEDLGGNQGVVFGE